MTKLGYIKIVNLGAHSFAGGLMIVDSRGLPLDFRYTDPVTPSKVQQVLYGKALDRHVRQDVIFKHLAEKMEPKPAILLVDDELLLDLPASVPVVMVLETRLSPLREAAQLQKVSDVEYMLQAAETGSPLRIKLAKAEAGLPEKVADILLEVVSEGLDPVEPFNRIRGAVDQLCAPSSAHD